jgi:PAS domain S-box-containing protein
MWTTWMGNRPPSGGDLARADPWLTHLVKSSPDGILAFDRECRYTVWNPCMERISGFSAERVLGCVAFELFPFLVDTGEDRCFHEALAGRDMVSRDRPFAIPESARHGLFEAHYAPLYDDDQRIVGGLAIVRDVTERRQLEAERISVARSEAARTEAEAASQRLAFLAAAGETLASSLDYERTLREVARLALPTLGDLCIVDVVEEGSLRRVATAHVREDKLEAVDELRRTHPPTSDSPHPAARVLRSGKPEVLADVSAEVVAAHTSSTEHARIIEGLQLRSHLAVPLFARGAIVAVISLGITESDRRYGEGDLSLATELGRVAALAIDNARLYRAAQQELLDRTRAEQAHRISAGRFRAVFEQSPLSTQVLRSDGSTARVNRAFEELWGLTLDELTDYNVRADPQLVEKGVAPYLELAFHGGSSQIPAIRYDPQETIPGRSTRSNAARWVRGFAYPVKNADGDVQEVVLVHEDVTARLEAEEQARASTERLRAALETTRLLAEAGEALTASLDFHQTLSNLGRVVVPRLADWCAIDLLRDEQTLERVAVTHGDPERVRIAFETFRRFPPRPNDPFGAFRVLRTGEPEWAEQIGDDVLEGVAHDAEHLELIRMHELRSYVCVPLFSRGVAIGVLTLVHAESGRRYTSSDVELARDLARRAATAVENARLFERLREQDRQKDEFLATLAHELRNPLAPLRSGIDVLRRADAQTSARVHGIMERQLTHIVRLLDDLLDLSRVTRGRIELQPEPLEVEMLLEAALDVSRTLMGARGVELTISKPATALTVMGDRTRLAQVLTNLLSNAAKYTPRGGHVELSVRREGDVLVLRVRDDGVGIPADKLEQIFEMFVQAHRTSGAPDSGLGIGLTLVRRLVELHGGRVWAESAGEGRGSTFVVRLPNCDERRIASEAAREQAPAVPASRLRVLVVDDNEDGAELLAMSIERDGHNVRTAGSGEAALELLREFRPEIAFVDIGLPGISGHELARRMRAMPELRVVLVAVTGWGQREDRDRSRAAGFDEHLTKPVDAEQIRDALARRLRQLA